MADFTVEQRDPRDLTPHPMNWRRHPKNQRDLLAYSLDKFDFVQGVIYNRRTERLIDGHARVEEAIEQGRETIPVNVVDLSEADERELLRLFDPIGSMAETDTDTLDRLIAEIGNPDLEAMLAGIGGGSGLLVDADPDAIPEAVETRSKVGDLWRLGEHRLLCGDCTVEAQVERLMGDDVAAVGFHDPPYGISYQSNARTATPTFDHLEGDHEVNGDWLPLAMDYLADDGACYICTRWDVFAEWKDLVEQHVTLKNVIVWDKVDWSSGDLKGDYSPRHEFILYCVKGRHLLRGHRESNVWAFGAPNKQNYVHPTQKKVELPAMAIEKSSDPGAVVIDFFAGSGTTLIACEQTGRVARCIEIEPRYCDVILARYEASTGREAVLIDG